MTRAQDDAAILAAVREVEEAHWSVGRNGISDYDAKRDAEAVTAALFAAIDAWAEANFCERTGPASARIRCRLEDLPRVPMQPIDWRDDSDDALDEEGSDEI